MYFHYFLVIYHFLFLLVNKKNYIHRFSDIDLSLFISVNNTPKSHDVFFF